MNDLSLLKGIFLGFWLLMLSLSSMGQVLSSAELKLMKALNTNAQTLPKDLQMTKSVVVISLGDDDNLERGDWHALAEEAHFYIKRLSIDAVLYFYVDDMVAGPDVQRAIAEQLTRRDIKSILMLSKDKVKGRDQFIGVLTPFDGSPSFISNNQPAWKSQTSDLEILFRNLARSIDRADLTLENLMIIDAPEYYRPTEIVRGKRFEVLNTDLRIDRLAVPKFVDFPVAANDGVSSEMSQIIQGENEKNLARNAQLEQIFATYPYEYRIVPYEYDEKKLLTQGFQFVLMRVNSSGENVRKLLDYKYSTDSDVLVSLARSDQGAVYEKRTPVQAMTYKYYIKHINSGDIFLGEQWDGDVTWQSAMRNHILTIIEKLKKD